MGNKNTTPDPDLTQRDDFGRAIRLVVRFYGSFIASAIVVYGFAQLFLSNSPLRYLFYIVALGILVFAITGLQRPVKPVYLRGEDDDWYYLIGWDRKIVGFIHAGGVGVKRIPILQEAVRWKRVTPLVVAGTYTAHTRVHDTFDVYVKVMFEIYPDWVESTKNARWLIENFSDSILDTAKTIIQDLVQGEMRQIERFSDATESSTERRLRDKLQSAFEMWQPNGVYINEKVTQVDIMVAQDVRRKRADARAELSRIQIIRDVARDMGITTDELLIQRALERLPDSRTRQSVSEIAAVLQMLRQQMPIQQLPDNHDPDVPSAHQDIRVDEAHREDEYDDDHPLPDTEDSTSYVEGYYEPVDDYDPDRDDKGPSGIYSPF